MSTALLDEVRGFLNGLEATQSDLRELYSKKRSALQGARADELIRLAETETTLTRALHEHMKRRHRILQQANRQGVAATTIEELIDQETDQQAFLGGDGRELRSQIADLQRMSALLRRESWIHWIIAHRAYQYHSELLDLIAQGGEKRPTYGGPTGSRDSGGGAILDHSI